MHVKTCPQVRLNPRLLLLDGIQSYLAPSSFGKFFQMSKPCIILDSASLLSPIVGCQNIWSHHISAVSKSVAENIKCQPQPLGTKIHNSEQQYPMKSLEMVFLCSVLFYSETKWVFLILYCMEYFHVNSVGSFWCRPRGCWDSCGPPIETICVVAWWQHFKR